MSYSKLHSSIVSSSLWTQSIETRVLFITLLAMADKDGIIFGSKVGLARQANIPADKAEEAWRTLLGEDPESTDMKRDPENQGRRIEELDLGGFRVINHGFYRAIRDEDSRKEQAREYQRKIRAARKASTEDVTAAEIAGVIESFRSIWGDRFKGASVGSSWHFDGAMKKFLPNLKRSDIPSLVAAFDAHVAGLASTKLFNPEKFCATWRSYLPSAEAK